MGYKISWNVNLSKFILNHLDPKSSFFIVFTNLFKKVKGRSESSEMRKVKIKKDKNCQLCGTNPTITSIENHKDYL